MEDSSPSPLPRPPLFSLLMAMTFYVAFFQNTGLTRTIKYGCVYVKICENLRAQAFSVIEEDSETAVWGKVTVSLPEKKVLLPLRLLLHNPYNGLLS